VTGARKMQVPPASTVVVLGCPSDVDLEIPGDCVVVSDASDAAQEDRLAWIAYPKSRQLGSSLPFVRSGADHVRRACLMRPLAARP
jgi:hypothetical protein